MQVSNCQGYMPLSVYVASSYRHLHAVHLLYKAMHTVCPLVKILDWTEKATPPAGLDAMAKKAWMDTDHEDCGKSVYEFCRDACASADLVIYYGASGQDVGVEVGIALGSGVEVVGLVGSLESPGLMLNGAVTTWVDSVDALLEHLKKRIQDKQSLHGDCLDCPMFGCNADFRMSFSAKV